MLAALVLLLGYALLDAEAGWWPRCLLRQLTGWSCPACGGQRALHALLTGHPLQALGYNYYLLVLIPTAALYLLCYSRPKRYPQLERVLYHRWTLLALAISALLWTLLRNLLLGI